MRKLVEFESQEIVCDNPECDYRTPYHWSSKEELIIFLNVPCPLCGQSLLTPKDYLIAVEVMRRINLFNKWFSWITIFLPKKKGVRTLLKTHNKVELIKYE